jgi:hypothetical protein
MAYQTLVIRIPAQLARDVAARIAEESGGYESVSEFACVALTNQLELEREQDWLDVDQAPIAIPPSSQDYLARLGEGAPADLGEPQRPGAPLFVLTNRMSPLKVAVRVLANMRLSGEWPVTRAFQLTAGREARRLGLRLRAEDEAVGRRAFDRRWVAYPVGDDEAPALERYIASFTVAEGRSGSSGPLAILGLAVVQNRRALLTSDGWRLAVAESPLLDGVGDGALSEEEALILSRALGSSPQEREEVESFLRAVRLANCLQGEVDRILQADNPDWSVSQVQSFRSAQVGRLSDIGVLRVTGRGPNAEIHVHDPAAWLGSEEMH